MDGGDWDAGLADPADPAAARIPVRIIRGDSASGSLLPDSVLPRFVALVGRDHVTTIPGAPDSPERIHLVETTAAILRAME